VCWSTSGGQRRKTRTNDATKMTIANLRAGFSRHQNTGIKYNTQMKGYGIIQYKKGVQGWAIHDQPVASRPQESRGKRDERTV